ncbi:MAG: acyltransferase family protein, partial [Candidatus Nanopelagicales bacterium]
MGQPSALISLGRSSAAEAPRKRRPGAFRPDIQGLRAIAVGLVVATHLFGWPTGGFVGVDVFFVISGFLITGLLMRELERTGGISMRNFYARRMRRIFPMSAIVLVCTVVAGFALFAASRADTTLVDAIWAFLFVENWHLVLNGADYFHATDAISPVQQYWSLSVEEQFYVVWPLLMLGLGAAAMARRRRRGAHEATAGMSGRLRAALGTAIGLIV